MTVYELEFFENLKKFKKYITFYRRGSNPVPDKIAALNEWTATVA